MANHQMSIVVAVLLVLSASIYVQSRTVSNRFSGLEKALSDASAAAGPSPGALQAPQPVGRSLAKRSLFDASCKGSYDRQMYKQLDRVCDDCYNLYRKPHVEFECSRDCFRTEMFFFCVMDLRLDIGHYLTKAQKLQGDE
ncbi:molt-inhibiting hormone-like isoform X1 [Oratosquilla oratoria]|uniref:molt-inhibiting hormone-like isoform X1 n=1 Tax=Oratosquilla oratoria TaxID=337810 RepID=UPI003F76C4FE